MAAWAAGPVITPKSIRFEETYRLCDGCLRPCPTDPIAAQLHRTRQAFSNCTLIPARLWREHGRHEAHFVDAAAYMGGEIIEGESERPESIADGCPGGWYRTPFFFSVSRYIRPTTADGVYSPNLNLDRSTDRLVLDAVQFYETEQARARHWANDRIADHHARQG